MSLGLSSLQDPSTNMLRLGATKLEHQQYPSGFHHQEHQFSNKTLQGLMQLPDLQTNSSPSSNNNLFNLSFFSGNDTSTVVGGGHDNSNHELNNIMGDGTGLSSIYSNWMQQDQNQILPSHTSATALLQKAAQMGSTTSSDNANATSNNDCSNLQGLMNSLANGMSGSIFGSGQDNINVGFGGGFIDHQQQINNAAAAKLFNVVDVDEAKLHQNVAVPADKLTLDFLGVGGMARNMSGGGGGEVSGNFLHSQMLHGMGINNVRSNFGQEGNSAQGSNDQQIMGNTN